MDFLPWSDSHRAPLMCLPQLLPPSCPNCVAFWKHLVVLPHAILDVWLHGSYVGFRAVSTEAVTSRAKESAKVL